MFRKRRVIQSLAALIALSVGLFIYLFDRQPETTYFLPHWIALTSYTGLSFGSIGYHLPTFVHIYTFILLTAVALSSGSVHVHSICATWFAIECLFEFGQHAILAPWIARIVPTWFDGIPFLENTANYFLRGTFDPVDLVAITAGTITAYLTILLTQQGELYNATEG